MTILDEIITTTTMVVEKQKKEEPVAQMARRFGLDRKPNNIVHTIEMNYQPVLIAELKRRSPSKGVLIKNHTHQELAELYITHGAKALSVLTDQRFFNGDLSDLYSMRCAYQDIPILRKDFIIDEYQIHQSYFYGADMVLLIVKALDTARLQSFTQIINDLGMTPLVEVHSRRELEIALECQPTMIGINNRNLDDFSVNLNTTIQLRELIPPEIIVVSESGISSQTDVSLLRKHRINAVLIGEAILTASNIPTKLRELTEEK